MRKLRTTLMTLVVVATRGILAILVGCTPVGQGPSQLNGTGEPSPFEREKYDVVLIVPVDKSGSFQPLMKPGGKGFTFLNHTIQHYFSKRVGNNDYLVVSLLGGDRQCIVWQGKPRELREDFTNVHEWAEFMDGKSKATGSRIWDGLSDSLEIVMSDSSMWNDHTKVVLVCISDMDNNLVDNFTSEARLEKNLRAFAKKGGAIGLYFVDPHLTLEWRKRLQEYGFKNFIVEPATVSRPKLPNFE